ncbi:MAG TPA: SDR family NAD(P)-dependent oxidoreductase [Pseudonocardiaceae bacterium]
MADEQGRPVGRRFTDRVVVVVGAGQTPGPTIGNGRATAHLFALEGAVVVAADRDPGAVAETVAEIEAAGGRAVARTVDATDEDGMRELFESTVREYGRIDVLHNNVGISISGNDAPVTEITVDAFDHVTAVNLRSMVIACKHAIPHFVAAGGGVITNISSTAAVLDYPYVAYKTSKAGVVALTSHLAIRYAPQGIRANCILPGLMNTPMAIENRITKLGLSREEVVARRDAQVPLRARMGTGWDVAHAALFLASDEAGFITGVALPVDGGQTLKIG